MKPRVILESPYAGNVERNLAYARLALRDSLDRGEAPIASHLLYTQVLDDLDPRDRAMGIAAGLAWLGGAQRMVLYVDHGISPSMHAARETAENCGVPVTLRRLFVKMGVCRWCDGSKTVNVSLGSTGELGFIRCEPCPNCQP